MSQKEIDAKIKLATASFAFSNIGIDFDNTALTPAKFTVPGLYDVKYTLTDYRKQVQLSRWFYENDAIAGTVINRMADMAITQLRNRRSGVKSNNVDDQTFTFYNAVAKKLKPFIKHMATEFLIHGLVVPAYTTTVIRGDLLSQSLGRRRYVVPDQLWARNVDNIVLKRKPVGTDRQIWLKIPKEDIDLILGKGKRQDGTTDILSYNYLLDNFPEYISAVEAGKTLFPLDDSYAVMRKITSYKDYPIPFLSNALPALQHKLYLKTLDRAMASRAIEAIRHIKTGSDEFPAEQSDVDSLKNEIANSSTGNRIFNFVTNHTVTMAWIIPPLDVLLSETKYIEPNADIFLALGFPRVLTVGETQRSNASDSKIASLGPRATLDDMRDAILLWVEFVYKDIAERNKLVNIPVPYFSPITTQDMTALTQFAVNAMLNGAISKDIIAQIYGSDFETESLQIQAEQDSGVLSPVELQQQHQFLAQQQQVKQNTQNTNDQIKE
jgi:hypothetical protein